MKRAIIYISLLLQFSCNKEKIISGDLAFKLVNFTPTNGFSKNDAKKVIKFIDSIEETKNSTKDSVFFYLKTLKDNNLLECPQIKIKTQNNDFETVFVSKKEFIKLKKFNPNYVKSDKKIKLILGVKEIQKNIFYSEKIISINEVKGKTLIRK